MYKSTLSKSYTRVEESTDVNNVALVTVKVITPQGLEDVMIPASYPVTNKNITVSIANNRIPSANIRSWGDNVNLAGIAKSFRENVEAALAGFRGLSQPQHYDTRLGLVKPQWKEIDWLHTEPYVEVKKPPYAKAHKAKQQALENVHRRETGDISTQRRSALRRKRKKK